MSALFLAQLWMFAVSLLWAHLPYRLILPLYAHPVARDTVALAIPLAARSVIMGSLLLALPPLLLSAWAASYPLPRRALAALAGSGGGLLACAAWQAVNTILSGYGFILRHSVPDPATPSDLAGVLFSCLFGVYLTLLFLPVRKAGGLLAWASLKP